MKRIWTNKQSRSSLITAGLSFILMISLLIATFQVTAWFNSRYDVITPSTLTNFQTDVQYRFSDGGDWITLERGKSIPLTLGYVKNNNNESILATSADDLQIRIQYTGKSNAYLRASVIGSYQNADTETVLPQTDGLWTMKGSADESSTKWIADDRWLQYSDKFGDQQDSDDYVDNYEDTFYSEPFVVQTDLSCLSSAISAHQDYIGELYVIVDAVQPDRIDAFWK